MRAWVAPDAGRLTVALLCAVAAAALVRPEPPRSDRHAAVEVEPRTRAELAMTLGLSVDVWSEQVAANRPLVVVLSPASLDALVASGVPHRIVVPDIAAVADAERTRLAQRTNTASWFADYRDLAEVNAFMDVLAERPAARVRELGTSIEGRPIRALEISRGGKIGIALDGGQHAREWISVMVPICIADRLLDESDPRARKILEAVSFYIVPVVNPDGYLHSWTVDRYWRKNRRGGYGVDLNRNYSVAWGEAGSSPDRSSPNYRGEQAFSEPETQAMRALFDTTPIRAHLDFHSYSQVIVYPWSHQRAAPPDRARFAAIADRMNTAMFAAHGQRYEIRPGSELTVGSSGTLGDWAYGEHSALSFLVELRPSAGGGGFVLPPEQIVPTCEESLAAVFEVAEAMIAADSGR